MGDAIQIYYSKISLVHIESEEPVIAELKVWKVPKDESFPSGIKYSLFLVSLETKKVIVGFDNHKPKGPHIHLGEDEQPYTFVSVDALIEDFWSFSKKEGFLL